jgi:hypothetical protein
MTLAVAAVGLAPADASRLLDPLAVNWRGLPFPVAELASREKMLVHPVKDADLTVEPSVREFFRMRRAAPVTP